MTLEEMVIQKFGKPAHEMNSEELGRFLREAYDGKHNDLLEADDYTPPPTRTLAEDEFIVMFNPPVLRRRTRPETTEDTTPEQPKTEAH